MPHPASGAVALAALLAAFPACVARAGASETRRSAMPAPTRTGNEAVVRELYEVALNSGDLDLVERSFAPDFVGPGGDVGPAAFARRVAELRAAFPDIRYTIEDVVEEGDRVAVRWTWTGTHAGRLRGFSPTGKKVSNAGFAMFQLRDGRIVRSWVETDRLGFLQQIGAVPPDLTARLQPAPAGRP